jgi:hypothetical protein
MRNRCIDDMSHDAEEVDESTDFINKNNVVAFVRFVNDGEIHENYLCCRQLPETSEGQDIFNVLPSYLETKGLFWENCIAICTDNTPSMFGFIRGFASDITTHCFVHREVLVSKTLRRWNEKKFQMMLQKNKDQFTPEF